LKKGCLITFGIFVLLIIGLLFGAKWFLKEAFGTTYRTVEIDNPVGKLICEEEYNADMAAVFFDVKFKLENKEGKLVDIGKLYFNIEDWQTEFELKENENWYYLSSNNSRIHDLILTDKISQENLSFNLNTSQPKNKKLSKTEKYNNSYQYSTFFTIDSIKQDLLYIEYEYKNNQNSYHTKKQKVEFRIEKLNKSLKIINKSELK